MTESEAMKDVHSTCLLNWGNQVVQENLHSMHRHLEDQHTRRCLRHRPHHMHHIQAHIVLMCIQNKSHTHQEAIDQDGQWLEYHSEHVDM